MNKEMYKLKEPMLLLGALKSLVDIPFPKIKPELHLDDRLEELPFLGCFFKEDLSWLDDLGLIDYSKFSTKIKEFRKRYRSKLNADFFYESRAKRVIKKCLPFCRQNWPCGIVRVKLKGDLSYTDSLDFDYKLSTVAFTEKGKNFYDIIKKFEEKNKSTAYERVTSRMIDEEKREKRIMELMG